MRLTKERILRSLQRELQQKQHDHRSKKVAKKYRMVKFFGEWAWAFIQEELPYGRLLDQYSTLSAIQRDEK